MRILIIPHHKRIKSSRILLKFTYLFHFALKSICITQLTNCILYFIPILNYSCWCIYTTYRNIIVTVFFIFKGGVLGLTMLIIIFCLKLYLLFKIQLLAYLLLNLIFSKNSFNLDMNMVVFG